MYYTIAGSPVLAGMVTGLGISVVISLILTGVMVLGIRAGFKEYERKQKMKEDLENEYQEKLKEYQRAHGYTNA